jgi:hypothetical protein
MYCKFVKGFESVVNSDENMIAEVVNYSDMVSSLS